MLSGKFLRIQKKRKTMKSTNACTGCLLESRDKNNRLCAFCSRRIQAAEGQSPIAVFPTQKDIDEEEIRLQKKYDLNQLLLSTSKNKTCSVCFAPVSKWSRSGLCSSCYSVSGNKCKMIGCNKKVSLYNKSGFCGSCLNIINGRRKLGLALYAPVKKRKKGK